MPNCFQLTRKGETEPSKLSEVDDAICAMLGVQSDPVEYVSQWYDIIGFKLALGKDFQHIRFDFNVNVAKHKGEPEILAEYATLLKIVDFLEENYKCDAWAEIGRRS